jgi:hypothetical protein
VVGNLADNEAEVVRIAGLLRATESAAQAVSVSLDDLQPSGRKARLTFMMDSTG